MIDPQIDLKIPNPFWGRVLEENVADRTADEPANVITLNTICSRISYLLLTELLPGEKELTQISKIFFDILYSILNSSKILAGQPITCISFLDFGKCEIRIQS